MDGLRKQSIQAIVICGGEFHDFDFARLEILKLLAEDDRVRTRVFECYDAALEALPSADFIISYTSNRVGSTETQAAFRRFVENGGNWFALHGTNSLILIDENIEDGEPRPLVHAPRAAPTLMQVLGSQFIAHPPIGRYSIQVTNLEDPIVQGLEAFEVTDELYLMELHGEVETLLHCDFSGEATGFAEAEWEVKKHPVMYRKQLGAGCVLYLTLGHCRGHYDMAGITDFYPQIERGAWEEATFYELLRRGIHWAKKEVVTES
ncbi:MAG: ThuA domain-containing protein [Pseudomonadota bacterium]